MGRRRRRSGLTAWLDLLPAPKPPFTDAQGRKGIVWDWLSRAPAHRVVTHRVPLAGTGARGWRVALLADLHVGSQRGDPGRLAAIVDETNALAPDLVLLLGDYVNMMAYGGGRVPPETTAAILSGLAAEAGVHAVLGNHDWKYGRDAVAAALAAARIPVIDNRVVRVSRGADALTLVGFPDDRWGEPDLSLLKTIPPGRPVLVATHDPGLFRDLPDGSVMVAGHMHGGQVRVPGLPAPVVPSGRAPRRWANGHIRERGGHLVVSAGLGASGIPFRWGMPPEIVLLELAEPDRTPSRP